MLVKGDGESTYFAADCAYYLDKRERGFDRVVIMLGADHHGYVGRFKALVAAFGDDPDRQPGDPHRPAGQPGRDGEPVRMSKRAGNVVHLEDLVDAIGVDAARYALARASVDQPIDIDLDLWTRQTNDNPVFYVQYAHARISSVLRNAADLGLALGDAGDVDAAAARRTSGRTTCCGRSASSRGWWPPPPSCASRTGWPATWRSWPAPTTGSTTPAGCCRAATRRPTSLTTARLWLCEATATVLRNGLACSACSAPERM